MTTTCAIWNTPAKVLESYGDLERLVSPRAGGAYEVTGTASSMLGALDDRQKAKLTSWLIDQRRLGNTSPVITSAEVEKAKASPPKSIRERRDDLIAFVAAKTPVLGKTVTYRANEPSVLAATESVTMAEVEQLIMFAAGQGLISGNGSISLTYEGHTHLDDMRVESVKSSQAFVAMWFNVDVQAAYDQGIEPAIRDAGYEAMRIDRKEHNNKIDDEIIAEIRRSRFLIADFTCGVIGEGDTLTTIPRGGVYYEAGFAQGFGIPVIWMCREDHINHVHFDTRQFNHITWKTPEELKVKLRNRIGAVLGDGPLSSTKQTI